MRAWQTLVEQFNCLGAHVVFLAEQVDSQDPQAQHSQRGTPSSRSSSQADDEALAARAARAAEARCPDLTLRRANQKRATVALARLTLASGDVKAPEVDERGFYRVSWPSRLWQL